MRSKNQSKLSILQPIIPHYRHLFFYLLSKNVDIDIYSYEEDDSNAFFKSNLPSKKIFRIHLEPFLLYNPWALITDHSKVLILMLHFGHLTTWFLLLTKWAHRKKIILWGQGISVKRYLKEEKKPDWKLKLMISLANGVWLYTEKEAAQWKNIFPNKPIVALNNTQFIDPVDLPKQVKKEQLKRKYNIVHERVLIFSARFENPYRRTDLLIDVIKKLDSEKYAFIIIGSGHLKPDFSQFKNVYDFGKLYDTAKKKDLFSIADIYFQPGWVGLSIVEAMSYSLPIFTFKRTEEIMQCVEYYYIEHKINGLLFESMEQSIYAIENTTNELLHLMGQNAFYKAKHDLSIENMVNNALSIL